MREAAKDQPSGSEAPENALPTNPQGYIFSEDTIKALTKLALLVREIERQQEAEESASKAAKPHRP